MQTKIAAYITCYRDEIAANRCIQAIESQSVQVSLIYIIDNSNQPLLLKSRHIQLVIHHYPDNIGIGEGIAKALHWASEQKYDFLWTFDQDSMPTENCLEILLSTYDQLSSQYNYRIGIIAPTPLDTKTDKVIGGSIFLKDHFAGKEHNTDVDFYECDSPITSGSLISLSAAKTIDPPHAELFIDGVDSDYGLRLRQKGFHNLIVTKTIMHHNFGNPIQIKFGNKYRYIQQYSALRHYYICRNHTYLELHFSQGSYRLTCLFRRIKHMIIQISLIIFYDHDQTLSKIWACLLGTYHGINGKLGKNW